MSHQIITIFLELLLNFLLALEFCIFLAIIFSWFPGSASHPLVRFIRSVAEPILKIARKIMPRTGMIDFSPLLAFFALRIIESIIAAILKSAVF